MRDFLRLGSCKLETRAALSGILDAVQNRKSKLMKTDLISCPGLWGYFYVIKMEFSLTTALEVFQVHLQG